MPKVSAIIPIYNSAKFLKKCLDSVINQTLTDIEIICVDDGSTDDSLEILANYIKKDDRIKLLKQQNLHAGVARNNGFDISTGDFVIFLDSDDFFEKDMFEKMYLKALADNSDIVICEHYIYNNKTQSVIRQVNIDSKIIKKSPFSPKDISEELFNFCSIVPWTKLFRRDFFAEKKLRFENFICCNDLTCICTALVLANKISIIDKPYVYYRFNQENNLTSGRNKNVDCFLHAIDKLEKVLKTHNLYEKYKQTFLSRAIASFNWETSLCNEKQQKERKEKAIKILSNDLYRTLYSIPSIPNVFTYDKKVSIIIPVYNTSAFLEKCLESVIKQTLKNIEIICINDGSTDNSLEILNKFKKIDNRITVIDIPNHGVGYARNLGLTQAKGEFVCFVDSDDNIAETFCEEFIKNESDTFSDLVCCGHFVREKGSNKTEKWLPTMEKSFQPVADHNHFTRYKTVTQKLFRKSIIDQYNIKFDTELHIAEDSLFLVQYLTHCRTITAIKKPLYIIMVNRKSLCRNPEFKNRRREESKKAFNKIYSIIDEYNKKSKPLVSIILLLHDTKKIFVGECIDSILNQTYKNVEIIIIDDYSKIINYEYLSDISPKIRLIRNEKNLKQNLSTNKAFKLARGKYIMRLGSDDVFDPKLIEREVNTLEKNPHIGSVCCELKCFGTESGIIKRPQMWDINKILAGDFKQAGYDGGMMFRYNLLAHAEFDDNFPVCSDFDFQLQLLEQMPIQSIHEPLYFYRTHATNISNSVSREKHKDIIESILQKHKNRTIKTKEKWVNPPRGGRSKFF